MKTSFSRWLLGVGVCSAWVASVGAQIVIPNNRPAVPQSGAAVPGYRPTPIITQPAVPQSQVVIVPQSRLSPQGFRPPAYPPPSFNPDQMFAPAQFQGQYRQFTSPAIPQNRPAVPFSGPAVPSTQPAVPRR